MIDSINVLIAEDNEDDALLMARELRKGGFQVTYSVVDTEGAFRAALLEGKWDAVLIDYSIPGFSGYEAVRMTRESGICLPVIAVSGVMSEDFAVEIMKAGADDYVRKTNLSRLAAALRRELREYEERRAHKRAQEDILLLNRILGTISMVNEMIVREKDKFNLLKETCEILVAEGGFLMALIGIADLKTGLIHPVAYSGGCADYVDCLSMRCDDTSYGNGPAGKAIKTGAHVLCKDIETDESFAPWRKAALECKIRSMGAFPIHVRGMTIGVINVYASDAALFGDKMVEILARLPDNVGFALGAIDESMERKNAAAALRESEERLRTIFESAMDGMFVIDMEGRYLDVNLAGCQMFGYTRDEILSSDISILVYPDNAAERIEKHKEYWRTGAFIPEVRLKKKDGSAIWVDMAITPFNVGERMLALGIKRDITDRKLAEEAIRESEERFHQVFEQNQDPQIILHHESCGIIDVNPAAVALFGYTREEIITAGPALLLGADHEKCELIIGNLHEGRSFGIDRIENVRKDGAKVIISMQGQLVKLKQFDVVYCTLRDITEKIRLEEEARFMQAKLIHANKMTSIGTLASGVAHEINNPNNFILFNSTLLSDAWKDGSRILDEYYRDNGDFSLGGLPYSEMCDVIPELLSGITDGSRRIKGIVDNLKNFSRAGKTGVEGELDVNRAVMSAASILNNQINKYTDNFHVSCDEAIPSIKGNEQKIEQVVINLIINALHSLPERKNGIWVHTSHDKDNRSVIIKVKDEGAGMSKEVLDRITEPFFTTKSDMGGTGLGLSISYGIIKEHRGALEFESAPGKGTVVTIKLPA